MGKPVISLCSGYLIAVDKPPRQGEHDAPHHLRGQQRGGILSEAGFHQGRHDGASRQSGGRQLLLHRLGQGSEAGAGRQAVGNVGGHCQGCEDPGGVRPRPGLQLPDV